MQIVDEPLEGLKLISFNKFPDDRGWFAERYSNTKFEAIGINNVFVQDNFSVSKPGVIRGLHYQKDPGQAKLVSVTHGKILDVAVDIRRDSKTFGKHYTVELSGENGLMLFIPGGFAHGFCAITEAHVLYKVDCLYNPRNEGGLAYNDTGLAIKWPVAEPLVSPRDAVLPGWQEYSAAPAF